MVIYLSLVFLLAALSFAWSSSLYVAWSIVVLMFLFSAFRHNVGFDYEIYYEWARDGVNPTLEINLEPLSKLMLEMVFYSGEPQYFFMLSSLIVVGLFGYSYIRCSVLPGLSLLAFFCLPLLYLVSFTNIRQSMAMAVVFLSLTVLEKRQKLALVMIIVAGMLHYSAFIMIFFWPFLGRIDRQIATKWYLFLLISAPVITLILQEFVLPNIPIYAHYSQVENQSGLKLVLFYYLLAFIVLWIRYRGVALAHRSLNLFIIGVLIFVVLVPINEVVGRIAYFFMPFGALLLPACIEKIQPVKLARFLFVLGLCCLFYVQLFIASHNPVRDPYLPYQFYPGWFGLL